MRTDRRRFTAGFLAAVAGPFGPMPGLSLSSPALAGETFRDSAGRSVRQPATAARIFPAGPPAAILTYALAPEALIGWPRANRPEEREFLLPGIGDRPELGRLTGRGNTTNLERLIELKPDLIVDMGAVTPTYVALADRVQEQTGIPYALIDGRFEALPAAFRLLGGVMGAAARGETLARYAEATMAEMLGRIAPIPRERRPRVYYARGPAGLETGLGGSINVETIEFLGAVNVAGGTRGGLATVSIEQVLAWDPEVIVTIDRDFAATVATDPAWRGIQAVRDRRIHLSPKLPFGWVDFPPSVNRLIGLPWLAGILYPQQFPEPIRDRARAFHALFYGVAPSEAQLDRILAGRT